MSEIKNIIKQDLLGNPATVHHKENATEGYIDNRV